MLYNKVFNSHIPLGTCRSLTVTLSSHYLPAFLFKEFPLFYQLELALSSQSTSQWKYEENLTQSSNHKLPSFSIAVSNMLYIIVTLMMLVLNSELLQVFTPFSLERRMVWRLKSKNFERFRVFVRFGKKKILWTFEFLYSLEKKCFQILICLELLSSRAENSLIHSTLMNCNNFIS